MASPAFLDLPNEILEDILERADLALPTLFGLGLSCNRLKEICLPLCLKHSGSPHPEDACKITVPRARRSNVDLKVLALATWITKTKGLECHFSDEKHGGDREGTEGGAGSFLAALKELARQKEEGTRVRSLAQTLMRKPDNKFNHRNLDVISRLCSFNCPNFSPSLLDLLLWRRLFSTSTPRNRHSQDSRTGKLSFGRTQWANC
jgi:hypothetical protein